MTQTTSIVRVAIVYDRPADRESAKMFRNHQMGAMEEAMSDERLRDVLGDQQESLTVKDVCLLMPLSFYWLKESEWDLVIRVVSVTRGMAHPPLKKTKWLRRSDYSPNTVFLFAHQDQDGDGESSRQVKQSVTGTHVVEYMAADKAHRTLFPKTFFMGETAHKNSLLLLNNLLMMTVYQKVLGAPPVGFSWSTLLLAGVTALFVIGHATLSEQSNAQLVIPWPTSRLTQTDQTATGWWQQIANVTRAVPSLLFGWIGRLQLFSDPRLQQMKSDLVNEIQQKQTSQGMHEEEEPESFDWERDPFFAQELDDADDSV